MDQYDFNLRFAESKGQPIDYNGVKIILADKIESKFNERFLVTIEETNSKYIQGVGVSRDIEIFGERAKRAMILESSSVPPAERDSIRSTLPFTFEIVTKNKDGFIWVYNTSIEDGRQQYWIYACAMIREQIRNGFRYRCNDKQPNDDFNDIIFRIERQ